MAGEWVAGSTRLAGWRGEEAVDAEGGYVRGRDGEKSIGAAGESHSEVHWKIGCDI